MAVFAPSILFGVGVFELGLGKLSPPASKSKFGLGYKTVLRLPAKIICRGGYAHAYMHMFELA